VLLLDEPTTGLDPASRQDLWDMIGTLVADGTTVLLTTQYLEEADRLADNIVVIDHGVVVAEGSAAALKSRIGETSLVLSFADATAATSAAQLLDPFGAHPVSEDVAAVSLPLRGGATTVRDVLNQLDAAGLAVGHLDLHEPTLDDVFLSLTGASS
jgi:ABC-2 type transport system ATP-binding protein